MAYATARVAPGAAEIGHDEQPETSEDGEGRHLQVAKDQQGQREYRRIHHSGARGAMECHR